MVGRRRGRRPGNQDTRAAILGAARRAFAEGGYDGTSIRQVAEAAGVDAALVHHYFGGKEQLFTAAVQLPLDPSHYLGLALEGDPDQLGTRILETFLPVWEHPVRGPAMAAMLRSAMTNQLSARLIREFFGRHVVRQLTEHLHGASPVEIRFRAGLVASQLFGLATVRYVLRFEPLASTPVEVVVRTVAPTVQRYLTGDLPDPPG